MYVYKIYKRVDRALTHHPADHWLGYLVAISGALMQMMSYGIDNSFSIFSNSMQNDATLGHPSATTVSFGNSVSLGLSPVFGVLAGFLVDRVPPRIMMFTSTVMLFAALWLSSTFATSSAQVTASFSLLASVSSAFMLSPGAAATGSWFRRRLGLAQGINFCGGGVGSAVVPAVLGSLVDVYGWRHTFRLMSAFCSIGVVGTILSCRRHPIEDDVEVGGEHGSGTSDSPRDPHREGEPTRHERDAREAMDDALIVTPTEGGEKASALQPSASPTTKTPTTSMAKVEAASPTTQMPYAMQMEAVGVSGRDSDSNHTQRETAADLPPQSTAAAAAMRRGDDGVCTVADLIQDMHTRRLTWREVLRVLASARFLPHFFMFAIYGWAFYGLIYVAVPYVSSMGRAGTVYADVTAISTAKASTVFTFWGVFQIVGSILVGGVASFTNDALAYSACAAVGGVATALLVFCRGYAAFAVCLSVVGFCTAGIFAMMPALIAKDFHGPNLGFFMGCVFVAGCLGGFSAPPIQAQLQTRYNGNYSYGCVFISCCMSFPGVLCYMLLWPEKQGRIGRVFKGLVKQA
ncbi:monocarboxylate transporter-like protein [Novymonas esmeraldas]|uniref:Monocarboxylate transporter-like protein n=1 Tax=Novymonas esmeraldas TaxID=1808958 RepID=A0AAW0EUG3_9TRYP